MTAALLLGLHTMLGFIHARLEESGTVLMDHVLKHDVCPATMYQMHQVQGAVLWIAFLLSPTGLLLAALMAEGALRMMGAIVAKETWGTLPLWLVDQVCRLATRALRRSGQKELAPDEIIRDGLGILVAIQSARAYAWDRATTLRFEERLYILDEHTSSGERQRPYLYRLRQAPESHLVRKLTDYAPVPKNESPSGRQAGPRARRVD